MAGVGWLSGNDALYYDNGGNIQPRETSSISMDKEILHFERKGETAQVTVYFEFNNRGEEAVTHLVGFQIQPPFYDAVRLNEPHIENYVRDFMVMHEENILPYQLMFAKDEDGDLSPATGILEDELAQIYVFLFEMTFQPGINRVHHSYEIDASLDVLTRWIHEYVLTSGSKWADNRIQDFTLIIDPEDNSYFEVSNIFGEDAEWNVVGIGKVFEKDDETMRRVRLLSGQLVIQARDFSPQENLFFQSVGYYGFIHPNGHEIIGTPSPPLPETYHDLRYYIIDEERVAAGGYTPEEVAFAKKYIYAMHGYPFEDPRVARYFRHFEWYLPNPNLTMEDLSFTEEQERFLRQLAQLETSLRQ